MDASMPPARPRPALAARDDSQDRILSYYQSEDAGQAYTPPPLEIKTTNIVPRDHRKQISSASSPSEYSPNTDEEPDSKFFQTTPSTATVAHNPKTSPSALASERLRRRPSMPSQGGADRRRLAVVDMSSSDHGHGSAASTSTTTPHDSIHSRRGIERPMHGLALVAPPDASPKTYTHLTPPATATLATENVYSTAAAHGISHSRSSSDITTSGTTVGSTSNSTDHKSVHRRKSSRQVGITRTSDGSPTSIAPVIDQPQQHQPTNALTPIFQLSQSRSSSPGTRSQSDISDLHGTSSRPGLSVKDEYPATTNTRVSYPLVITPDIGEGKDIQDPVAAPIIVSLTPSSPPTARPPRRSPSPTKISPRSSSPESLSTAASSSGSSYPSPSFSSEAPSSYLYYQPGIHATAGPLPPPPRAVFNITPGSTPPPRPPRLNSPPPPRNRSRGDVGSVKQALQLPDPVTGSLSGKTSSGSLSDAYSNSARSIGSDQSEIILSRSRPQSAASDQLPPASTTIDTNHSSHIREGAFPSSASSTEFSPVNLEKGTMDDLVADVGNAIDDVGLMSASDVPPPTVIEPPRSSEMGHVFKRDDSWVSATPEDSPRPRTPVSDEGAGMSTDSGRGPMSLFRRSTSRSPPKVSKEISDDPSPSPSSPRQLRTLGANLKRFSSLPRTPSRKSEKRLSTSSRSSNNSSVSASSTVPPPVPEVPAVPRTPPPVQKIIAPWPSAMFYSEVLAKKTALERSLGYAAKINELYIYDCGLGEFLMDTRSRANQPRKRSTLMPYGSRGPSSTPNSLQPRHLSRSSVESEATFPRRADTTTATDLGYHAAADTSSPHGPPALPYPALAQPSPLSTSQSSPNASLSSASSARLILSPKSSKPSSGFFSSLGRKASTKTKEPGAHTARLQKAPTKLVAPNPRPVDIPSSPTVPGGPRAAPYRVTRSQTIMLPKSPPASIDSHRSSSVNRRPSLFGARRPSPDATSSNTAVEVDPEFVSQVDKLADLLPHADREVLAGYLRRAGSDLNAIGQYLDDEKNGALRRD